MTAQTNDVAFFKVSLEEECQSRILQYINKYMFSKLLYIFILVVATVITFDFLLMKIFYGRTFLFVFWEISDKLLSSPLILLHIIFSDFTSLKETITLEVGNMCLC